MEQETKTTGDEVLRRDPEASTAAALWRTRCQATNELYDEIERLRAGGYMLTEIARACGATPNDFAQLLRTENAQRRVCGPPS